MSENNNNSWLQILLNCNDINTKKDIVLIGVTVACGLLLIGLKILLP